ncbi:MAG TPA: ATP-binding protein, partial [Anaerolineae bacterium]|nr:ATP-binding protein [Anaerolineae bacterium]
MIQEKKQTIEALQLELEQAQQRIAELENLETERLAEQLRAKEERFRQVINSISDHIYVTEIASDGTHINLYISPHAETLTGYSLSMVEADWNFWPSLIIYPDDRMIATAQAERLAQGIDSEVEYRIMRADGQVIWVRDSGRVTHEGEAVVVYGVVSDITVRKQAEEKRRHAQKMEAIGQLAGGVAHDFNNLLTVISGQCELLLKDAFHPNDPRRYEINEIKIASERAIMLTQQLLTFSRQRPVHFQVLNLNDVIDQIKNMLGRLIGENIDLVDHLAPDLPSIKADAGQIEQVLLNLAINARDAMPKGGSLTIVTTAIKLDPAKAKSMELIGGRYVRLTVTDTGAGINPAVQARIFEPFFTTKAIGEGTGLGLSTVYGIVRQLGGQ